MKQLDGYRETLVLIGCVVVIIVGGGGAKADFTFGELVNLGPTVNSTSMDGIPNISVDGLSLYFASDRPGGYGQLDIWVTERATTKDKWGEPVNLGPTVNSSSTDVSPAISSDGLSLYFDSDRPWGHGNHDIWVTERQTGRKSTELVWGTPINLGPNVNSSALEFGPSISTDGLQLYFSRGQTWTSTDIWLATRASIMDQWGSPVKLGPEVNVYGSFSDCAPSISSDGLALFFSSTRAGGQGSYDLWMSKRDTLGEPWGVAINLGPTVNSGSFWEADSDISSDGRTLYFCDHGKPLPGGVGGGDLWQVSIIPIVDLNADGIVDSADMCIMVDHWGENYPLCDIGPMPWGDGIVDVQDLIVLAEHLFEEVPLVE